MRLHLSHRYPGRTQLCILFLAFSISTLYAQKASRTENRTGSAMEATSSQEGVRPEDRKAFTKIDSAIHLAIFRWNLDKNTNKLLLKDLDTTVTTFRNDYPFFREYTGASFLGYLGSPVVGFDYFKRPQNGEFMFWTPYESYAYDPASTDFFNTLTSFTKASYIWAGSRVDEEESLELFHTQNITPRLNFALGYKKAGTLGIYKQQDSKTSGLSINLNYLGDIYSAHAGFITNKIKGELNGGITNDSLITNTVVDPNEHEVRLNNATTALNNISGFLCQSVDLPLLSIGKINDSIDNKLMTRLGHYFEYSKYGRHYKDDISSENTDFYSNFFYNDKQTFDSTSMQKIENRVFLHLHPLKQSVFFESLYGGIASKVYQFRSMSLGDTSYTADRANKQELSLYAGISAKYKDYFRWSAYGEYHIAGYKANDVLLKADLGVTLFPKSFPVDLLASGSISNTTPDYFMENFVSNHYRWQNNFDKTNEIRVEGKLSLSRIGLQAMVSQSVLTDPLYFDQTGIPRQHSGSVSITSVSLKENLRFGPWNMHHKLLFQHSTDQTVMPLPSFAAQLTYFFDFFLVKNVLKLQIGFDMLYNTAYKGYAFNPASGMFHAQSEKSFGNYPWFDVFVAAKWKVVTPFVKYEHANQGMINPSSYFSALHYPRNPSVLKFGISWNFYD